MATAATRVEAERSGRLRRPPSRALLLGFFNHQHKPTKDPVRSRRTIVRPFGLADCAGRISGANPRVQKPNFRSPEEKGGNARTFNRALESRPVWPTRSRFSPSLPRRNQRIHKAKQWERMAKLRASRSALSAPRIKRLDRSLAPLRTRSRIAHRASPRRSPA